MRRGLDGIAVVLLNVFVVHFSFSDIRMRAYRTKCACTVAPLPSHWERDLKPSQRYTGATAEGSMKSNETCGAGKPLTKQCG